MSFSDPDPIESHMGKPVTEMNDTELVSYIKLYLQVAYDISLPTTAQRERAIMAKLKRTYGPEAGQIIKWALLQGPVAYSEFSTGQKWKTDKWALELQIHLKQQKAKSSSSHAFSRLEDL